ncbi:MAG TPA: cupredoxin domain-containing protein [Actinomycetota bacterium]
MHASRLAVIAMVAVSLSACGGGGTSSAPTTPQTTSPATSPSPSGPACAPSGTSLEISSAPAGLAFDKRCLAAPANAKFTISFHNQTPGVTHSVAIATPGLANQEFTGKVVTGPTTITYHVPALQAGTYEFYCTVHPSQMNGTFIVS